MYCCFDFSLIKNANFSYIPVASRHLSLPIRKVIRLVFVSKHNLGSCQQDQHEKDFHMFIP